MSGLDLAGDGLDLWPVAAGARGGLVTDARFIVGDVFDVLESLPDRSVQSVITSPPYWRKRRYLPEDHPDAAKEIGQEPSPGEFLATMLRLTNELWRIVRDDGTIWINLGDTAAKSGGAGGDYGDGGKRAGQNKFKGTSRASGADIPLAKSVCWIPELFGASLAYGRNLLTGEPCQQWITRPKVTWCKPSVTPGEVIDRFRVATELIVWASKGPKYYFDLDAVREPPKDEGSFTLRGSSTRSFPGPGATDTKPLVGCNPKGVPPLDWWEINTSGYPGAHFATFPPELIIRPVVASCPLGGTILDPFGGSGTTAAVATGHGRKCISIDFDDRNAELARDRVGMFLDVEHHQAEVGA